MGYDRELIVIRGGPREGVTRGRGERLAKSAAPPPPLPPSPGPYALSHRAVRHELYIHTPQVKCLTCSYRSHTFDHFEDLSIEVWVWI